MGNYPECYGRAVYYSIHLSNIQKSLDADWQCPVCFEMQSVGRDEHISSAYSTLKCECGAEYVRQGELRPEGTAPKRGQAIFEGPEPKFRYSIHSGAVFHMLLIYKPGTMDGDEHPCREYWECPGCDESRSTRVHLGYTTNSSSWFHQKPPTNLWCSSCERTFKRMEDKHHRLNMRYFPCAAIVEYDPATVNRLELLFS